MGTRDQTIVAGEVEDVPVREAILCYCQCMQITLQASFGTGMTQRKHHLLQHRAWSCMQPANKIQSLKALDCL